MKDILIVDDEEDIRSLLKRVLEIDGHRCELAADGQEALEMMSNNEFELILSDIRMPIMDGVEFLKKVKEQNDKPPLFIFISAFSEYSKDDLVKLGAFDLLKKPEGLRNICNYVNAL